MTTLISPASRRRPQVALTLLACGLLATSWTVWQRGRAKCEERYERFSANVVSGWDVQDSFAWTAIANRLLLPYNAVSTLLDALGCAALVAAWGVRRVRTGWKIAAGVPFVLSPSFHGLCLLINVVFGPLFGP